MTGRDTSSCAEADPRLFYGAGLIVTPPDGKRPRRVSLIERVARYIGFSEVIITTPGHHDAMIAYTGHLTRIAAAAICLDRPEGLAKPYAGGAFRDGTRAAAMNEGFWAQILLENRENVLEEIKRLQQSLQTLRQALDTNDAPALSSLLRKAKQNRETLGGG
jgi:prephenate dehydrogenase